MMESFLAFYFDWISGLGGWVIFAFVSALLAIAISFDTDEHPQALLWRMAAWASSLLTLPSFFTDLASQLDANFNGAASNIGSVVALEGIAAFLVSVSVAISYFVVGSQAAQLPKARPQRQASALRLRDLSNGQLYPLWQGLTSIGRDNRNDIALNPLTVSRFHAQINVENGQTIIKSLSQQGVVINGYVMKGLVAVNAGDVIELGKVKLQVTVGG